MARRPTAKHLTRFAWAILGGTIAALSTAHAATGTYAVLHQFSTRHDRGYGPNAVVLGPHGVVYGTTSQGGKPMVSKDACRSTDACGTLYRLGPDGTLKVLHTFYGLDAGAPTGALVLRGNTLYGTTRPAGPNGGTVFTIGIDGTGYKALYTFKLNQSVTIGSGLAVDPNGVVYGTTLGPQGSPILFKLAPDGTFSGLITSTSSYQPIISLVLNPDGTLTFEEYIPNTATLMHYDPTSGQTTAIYTFPPCGGCEQLAGTDAQGDIFGFDTMRKSHLFEFVKTVGGYRHEMLWTFNTIAEDYPTALTLLPGGGLIGTTYQNQPRSGLGGTGTLFAYAHHQLTTLFRTRTAADGLGLYTAPVMTGDGKIIGAAQYGGDALCIFSAGGCGVVYTYRR